MVLVKQVRLTGTLFWKPQSVTFNKTGAMRYNVMESFEGTHFYQSSTYSDKRGEEDIGNSLS